jgi:hypothetical protein
MAQYLLFLALAPVTLAGSLSALLLPRIVGREDADRKKRARG